MRCRSLILLMVGLAAAWATVPAAAQRSQRGGSPLIDWREQSQGMSTNAALAFYRVRNTNRTYPSQSVSAPQGLSPVSQPIATAPPYYRGNTYQPRPYFAIPAVGYAAPPAPGPPAGAGFQTKPFAQVRPTPNAIDRYWPLLMERREDPNTGLIIWQLP